MRVSMQASPARPRAARRWTKARTTAFLRLTLVVTTAYLVLGQSPMLRFEPAITWLVLGALSSNIPFLWLPRRVVESVRFGALLVVLDTLWITALLYYGGHLDADFYVVYFFVLFLAAISESLPLMTLGTVLVSFGYLYSIFVSGGPDQTWSLPTLVRLPFIFAVAALYGFLANEVRRERQISEDLLTQAQRDPLTQVGNRRTLETRLQRCLARVARSGRQMALLVLDLDDFKYVNDTHGHDVGDSVLVSIAGRLQRATRSIDTVARLGGDEFAIVLTEVNGVEGVATVARRLKEVIAEPVQVRGFEIATTATIGVAVMGVDDDPDVATWDPETVRELGRRLMGQADRALYRAKRGGKDGLSFYDADMNREAAIQVALAQELKGALDRGELHLEYQPQIDIESGTIVGAEALLRWRNPGRGLVPPNRFIPIAENTGQIREIGAWVLETACREAIRWQDYHPMGLPVAVNLSAVQFRDPDFSRQVITVLHDSGLAPRLLELELTEGVFLRATPSINEAFQALHDDVGVGISLDDFGRGFSSLEYLCRFPIDRLKVDQLFVGSIEDDPDSRVIVGAVLALARGLGLSAIAEGVETERQVEFLIEQGCRMAQGYYFSKPISGAEMIRLLRDGSDRVQGAPGAQIPSRARQSNSVGSPEGEDGRSGGTASAMARRTTT